MKEKTMKASLETLQRRWRAAADREKEARKDVAKAKSALYLAELYYTCSVSDESLARYAMKRAKEAADE
jgi:hypothetical protein